MSPDRNKSVMITQKATSSVAMKSEVIMSMTTSIAVIESASVYTVSLAKTKYCS